MTEQKQTRLLWKNRFLSSENVRIENYRKSVALAFDEAVWSIYWKTAVIHSKNWRLAPNTVKSCARNNR